MKILILFCLILSPKLRAVTFEVLDRGHEFSFIDTGSLSLIHSKATMTIIKKPCSEALIKDLSAIFKSSLSTQLSSPGKLLDSIRVKTDAKIIYLAAHSENGTKLRNFPDTFIKSYLIHKKICLPK